jgi:hypothetical protein
MNRLTRSEARKIINEWYLRIEDNNDKSSNGLNFKIHPVSREHSNLDIRNEILNTRKEIIDFNINEYSDLYIRHKDDHKVLMERLVASEVAFRSINSLLEKITITGEGISAPKLILDLTRIAFDNQYRARDVVITKSEKTELINDAIRKHDDYLAALRVIDFYVGSNQAGLQSRFYKSKTEHVIAIWQGKKKTVSRPSNKNSRRLDMFGQFAIYFNDKFGTPLWSDVLSITSAFYDCDDLFPENIRTTLSKKLGLTRKKP